MRWRASLASARRNVHGTHNCIAGRRRERQPRGRASAQAISRASAGKPLLAHALDHLDHPAIDAVQVVIGEGQEEAYRAAVARRALPSPLIGGATRRHSVRERARRARATRTAS